MQPSSLTHCLIAGNVAAHLHASLAGAQQFVYTGTARVEVDARGMCMLPDVAVTDEGLAAEGGSDDTLLNPLLIIEVLSPSTESFDRGAKFAHYRQLPSLQEYVLIAQDKVAVERFVRQGQAWLMTEATSLDAIMPLESVGCELPLSAVYARVDFSTAESTEPRAGE